ncbi:hypothetical protein P7C70_g7651, partial [Phenoliferia sp. Uapishka_3]
MTPRPQPEHFAEELLDKHLECRSASPLLSIVLILIPSADVSDTYDNGSVLRMVLLSDCIYGATNQPNQLLIVARRWKYEFWVKNHERIVYAIHGGPMAGRKNYQTAYYQRIRENLWQVSWIEETGTTVTITLDRKYSSSPVLDFAEWRSPTVTGHSPRRLTDTSVRSWMSGESCLSWETPRRIVTLYQSAQATLDKVYQGKGELADIEMDWPTVSG